MEDTDGGNDALIIATAKEDFFRNFSAPRVLCDEDERMRERE
tara:strand:+ start:1631 stop:1756 length:126 start_codon:yes stop_codon:yes gene_type:complete